ncbi:hypothetical protein BV25DRAFT_1829404 [Artomyces pyxidatus]|uniref:Uncharacterized protein n=1 Tax=Artomyces pyxidatus TaxID=48021 RepID=A0ACB8ST95_9AGAM|nr:hypothetical protein BV25DRAFT_1829404 [Artomyces pyxidatus]
MNQTLLYLGCSVLCILSICYIFRGLLYHFYVSFKLSRVKDLCRICGLQATLPCPVQGCRARHYYCSIEHMDLDVLVYLYLFPEEIGVAKVEVQKQSQTHGARKRKGRRR